MLEFSPTEKYEKALWSADSLPALNQIMIDACKDFRVDDAALDVLACTAADAALRLS